MVSEHVQDLGHNLLMVFDHASVYQDIVHIDRHISFINEVLEDVIHHGLEGGQAVGEAKEHDQGFEEAPCNEYRGLWDSPGCWQVEE